MALKKYTAKTHISLSIVLPHSGKSLHLSFTPLTGGGSVYYTEIEQEQCGLERHSKYGKLFKGEEVKKEIPTKEETSEEKTGKELKVVKVACADDAKDYLSDKCGISRTKLRGMKAIEDTAHEVGIVFTGL